MADQTCPGCGLTMLEEEWEVDIRQRNRGPTNLVSVGFRCPRCGRIWGHEI